ncbi:F-box protein interaction domain protein [Medicago truncatula]|uniref:F-box protein interaction domain protein n=1 Tax=Medicago truncatula TaxID=3880 RepID=G7K6C0_MEDTR|nr:F-box protein interaction domain protein [Medicago truncatula]
MSCVHLPDELIAEVLSFLPVKSLINHIQKKTIFWFHIWNPATRIISKKLGTCHQPCRPGKLTFSFGYDNSTRTYNAVVLCSSEFTPYNLVDTLGHSVVNQQGVYLSGTVNWISIYPEDVTLDKFAIISLDIGTETYKKLLPPPGAVNLVPPYIEPTIATLMDCLCFSHHLKKTHFVIWQMIEFGFEQSWTQFLKISFQNLLVDKFGYVLGILSLPILSF